MPEFSATDEVLLKATFHKLLEPTIFVYLIIMLKLVESSGNTSDVVSDLTAKLNPENRM